MSNSNEENQDANRAPESRNGSTVVIIVVSLMAGVALLLGLLVLRTNERGGGAIFPPTASTNPLIRKTSSDEIQKWISDSMKKTNSKVGVVNIWATWCAPCRDEMPELAKFQKTAQAPLFLISADNELDEPLVAAFLKEMGVGFESTLIQGDQQIFIEKWQSLSSKDPAKQWSMTLPATFLVNNLGEVISFHVGATTAAELTGLVKKTLDTAQD